MITLLDSEEYTGGTAADLAAGEDVLTHTPSATNHTMCQAFFAIGSAGEPLTGAGGSFLFQVVVGGRRVQPYDQIVSFASYTQAAVWTAPFPVPANDSVLIAILSPNSADTAVYVKSYLYDVSPLAAGSIAASTFAAGAIDAAAIADSAIGAAEIAAAAVTKIQAGLATPTNITSASGIRLADGAITAAKIATSAVGAAQVAGAAVTKIQAGLAAESTLANVHSDVSAVAASVAALSDLGDGAVSVNHNYSATDYLRYTTNLGAGINNADVLAYLTADYASARTGTGYIQGRTSTDANGRWVDSLRLDYGTSASSGLAHTIVFNVQGLYGPDTKAIVVKV